MSPKHKPLAWLHGAIQSPPFSATARLEVGFLLRQLQAGRNLGLPHSRPMPAIGKNCHELRINDATATWRVFYAIEPIAIVIIDVVTKKTEKTSSAVLDMCGKRIAEFRRLSHE